MTITRVQPNNPDAEVAVLGGLLQVGQEAIVSVADILPVEAFYSEKHQKIYAAALTLFGSSEAIDTVSVTSALKKAGDLEKIGEVSYLYTLYDSVPEVANIEYYAGLVLIEYRRRKLISLSVQMHNQAQGPTTEVEDIVGSAEDALLNMDGVHSNAISPLHSLLKPAFEYIQEVYNTKQGIIGTSTGFPDLDRLTSGFKKANLIIVAGRPGMGKSMLVQNIVQHVAMEEKKPVFVYSAEMSKEEIVMRMIASQSRVSHQAMTTGRFGESDWPKITVAAGALHQAPIYIDDEAGLTPMQLLARCRRAKMQYGIEMVVVDYLQLMRPTTPKSSETEEVGSISYDLKRLAKQLQVPVVAVSQLSRSPEGRTDKRPQLSDLRQSGKIEEAADLVLMLYRDAYYSKDVNNNITEVDIAKQRNGPSGLVKLLFQGAMMRFESLSREKGEGTWND